MRAATPGWPYTELRESDMGRHKFKVGQLVDFAPSRPGVPTSSRRYEVMRLLPAEGGEYLYRVKSRDETFERMARESELARSALL